KRDLGCSNRIGVRLDRQFLFYDLCLRAHCPVVARIVASVRPVSVYAHRPAARSHRPILSMPTPIVSTEAANEMRIKPSPPAPKATPGITRTEASVARVRARNSVSQDG